MAVDKYPDTAESAKTYDMEYESLQKDPWSKPLTPKVQECPNCHIYMTDIKICKYCGFCISCGD
jgi:hypothetical protein